MANVAEIVRADSVCSANRWDGAVDSAERDGDADAKARWAAQGEACAAHYETALEFLAKGDTDEAIESLEEARLLEADAGDDGDARHAIAAVRSSVEVTP